MERLLEDLHRVAARDHDARGQVHRIVQALDRSHCLAGRDLTIPEGLHPEDSDPLLHEDRQDLLLEAFEVSVHHVQRHLDRVELEPMRRGRLEHPQMDRGTLVSCEADVPDPPRILRLEGRLNRTPLAKIRSGSSIRMISWNCRRSMTSVWSRRSDSSICRAAAVRVCPSIFVMRKARSR